MREVLAPLSAYELGRAATRPELDAVVNVLVGVERDRVLSPGPFARLVIGATLADALALGAG